MALPIEAITLVIVVSTSLLLLFYHLRAIAGKLPLRRRPLPGLAIIERALAQGAETGRAIHLSPGSGSIGQRSSTAETVAGLLAAERVAAEAAVNGAPILASSGDAVAHLALRGTLRQAYQEAGLGQDYDSANVQLLAHQDAMAYASGVTTLYGRQQLEASQLIGNFGHEFMLAGEVGAQRAVPQLVGTTTTTALPLAYLTAEAILIGEEIYAVDAYLARASSPMARLRTQDVLRTLVIFCIVVVVLLAAAGLRISF